MIVELARDCWRDPNVRQPIIGLGGLFLTFFLLTLIVASVTIAAVVVLMQMAIIGIILLAAWLWS